MKHLVVNKNQQGSEKIRNLIFKELYQQIPFNVAVIDADFNIVEANNNFAEHFGKWQNKKCYAVYKKINAPCKNCPTMDVFTKGKPIVCDSIGIDKNGIDTHYIAHSFPIKSKKGNKIEYAMEMTRTVTETDRWQREYHILFDRVPCFITVIGEDYRIVRANEAFRDNFGDMIGQHCFKVYKRRKTKCRKCPAEKTFKDSKVHHSTKTGIGKQGQKIHYAVTTSALMRGKDSVAHVIEISNDITALKQLEYKVIEAERLGAVGQTVAGLAHSIKNILMGLEGGKYIVSLGLAKDDKVMINQGWEMLERNFEKTTSLVKDFLSFSKGRLPELKMVNPGELVSEIIDLYKDIASQSGISLKSEIDDKIKLAPLDAAGIHTCLTNLVSNAIDACLMGEQKGNEVIVKVFEERGQLVFEVKDNGSGLDNEIKKKIFTTFFTTKGGGGTGLGLLTTRKIVQEHGGKIVVDSQKGKGSKFKIIFPRNRLMTLYKETKE